MYGKQNNTRLSKVAMVVIFDTVLCGANTFDHGRHIWCNGTRQYQPKGNDNMRHAKYLVSPSHDGVMTSKRFPYCWPFVGKINCSPVYFPHKGPWMRSFEVSFVDSLKIHENSYLPESHEDVIKWWISPHKGQWRGAWIFSLICAWTNGWANNRDAGDFRCHRAHYAITLMDRDFRRRDAHVAAPYWGHDLVLTTQGNCFPNFKTTPCFKHYVLLQWRCMSDRVSDQCQHDFCSRTFFLIDSVRCVTLPFLFAKPVPKNSQCVSV